MSETRRERQLGWMTPNQQRYEAPSVESLREAIERQVCPFCGAGPFTVLATHVNAMHDINREALREMAGFTMDDSICDPTHSAKRSDMSKVLNRETLEQRVERNQRLWREKTKQRDERICAMSRDGKPFTDIASELDVPYVTVMHVARRFGLHREWGVGTDRTCEWCGEHFVADKPSAAKRFCNTTCANRATTARVGAPSKRPGWRPAKRRHTPQERTCLTCGDSFTVEWPSQTKKYCTHQCYARRSRAPDA